MKKKVFWIAVCMCVLLCTAAFAAEQETAGFSLVEASQWDGFAEELQLYRHENTGAEVLFLRNDDPNCAITLAFRAPAIDDMGLPHVFEHSTLYGSRKYPSYSLYNALSSRTYNTYMNAMTTQGTTIFQAASLSEEQLLCYADFYVDSCLHPMVCEDESIFLRQAWHYSMEEPEDDLDITGVIYNELRGAASWNESSLLQLLRLQFPGSICGNASGGTPESLCELSWQDVCDYHEAWYHPSNMMIVLYGKIDRPEEFLKLLDSSFAGYEFRECAICDEGYVPVTESVEGTYTYPASSASAESSMYLYSFPCGQPNEEDRACLGLIAGLLNSADSRLQQAIRKELPDAQCDVIFHNSAAEPTVIFQCRYAESGDEKIFRKIVDETVDYISRKGFASKNLESFEAANKLSTALLDEVGNAGVEIGRIIAEGWSGTDNVLFAVRSSEVYASAREYSKSGALKDAVGRYILNNGRTAFLISNCEPGGEEKLEEERIEALRAAKEAMTAEEIAAVVERTHALDAPRADDTDACIQALTAVTIESLPEELRTYDIVQEKGAKGSVYYTAETNTDGVAMVVLNLDVSSVKQSQLQNLALYCSLVGDLPTTNYSLAEVQELKARYLRYVDMDLVQFTPPDGDTLRTYLSISVIAAEKDLGRTMDVLYEVMFQSKFTDKELMASLIRRQINNVYSTICTNSINYLMNRMQGAYRPEAAFEDYCSGMEYHTYLIDIYRKLDAGENPVQKPMSSIRKVVRNRTGALIALAGSRDSVAAARKAVDKFLGKLTSNKVVPKEYTFEIPARREAICISGNVQNTVLYADATALELSGDDAAGLVTLGPVCSWIEDRLMQPTLREKNGAYSAGVSATEDGLMFYTYSDPNIAETYAFFEELPDLIAQTPVDQETLNGYILSCYADIAMPEGELVGAIDAISDMLLGYGSDFRLRCMHALKSVTPDTVRESIPLLQTAVRDGMYATAGNGAKIRKNAELFDEIFDPFDLAFECELVDVDAEDPRLEAFLYLIRSGLMDQEDGYFRPDDPLRVGTYAYYLHQITTLGIVKDEKTAIEHLSEYGLTPNCDPDTVMTRDDFVSRAYKFCDMIGHKLSDAKQPDVQDMQKIDKFRRVAWSKMVNAGYIRIMDGRLEPDLPATRADFALFLYSLITE